MTGENTVLDTAAFLLALGFRSRAAATGVDASGSSDVAPVAFVVETAESFVMEDAVVGVVTVWVVEVGEYSRSKSESIDELADMGLSSVKSVAPSSSEGESGLRSKKETGGAGAVAAIAWCGENNTGPSRSDWGPPFSIDNTEISIGSTS